MACATSSATDQRRSGFTREAEDRSSSLGASGLRASRSGRSLALTRVVGVIGFLLRRFETEAQLASGFGLRDAGACGAAGGEYE